jgi:hypothetical protein
MLRWPLRRDMSIKQLKKRGADSFVSSTFSSDPSLSTGKVHAETIGGGIGGGFGSGRGGIGSGTGDGGVGCGGSGCSSGPLAAYFKVLFII